MLLMLLSCRSSRIFARRACSSGLRSFLPDTAFRRSDNYKANTRQGVAVEYIPQPA